MSETFFVSEPEITEQISDILISTTAYWRALTIPFESNCDLRFEHLKK